MGPIDYSIDVATPFQSAMQGFQSGLGMRQALDQRAEAERQRAAQAQMQADLGALADNPNASARDYAALMTRYPQLSEQLKRPWDALNAEQQQSSLSMLGKVTAALHSATPEVAVQVLRDSAAAMRNSGDEKGAKVMEDMARIAELDPAVARTQAGLMAAAIPGGEKLLEGLSKIGSEQRAQDLHGSAVTKAGGEARKAVADASTAEVKAKFAPSQATMELEKAGWDIKKIQSDIAISKENARINAITAAMAREGNDLKREELRMKAADAITKRDEKIREKTAEAESAVSGISDTLALINDIRSDPDGLTDAIGVSGWSAAIPGSKSRTVAGKIEQLSNSLAAANLDKLKGAMSDKDIAFLKNIAANLDRMQDEDAFMRELARIEQTMQRADERLRKKFGMPVAAATSTPGGATGSWDGSAAPAAAPAAGAQRTVTVDF